MIRDYAAWGNNCRILNMSQESADTIIQNEIWGKYDQYSEPQITAAEFDQFWEGFYYGTNTEIVPIV